MNLLFLTPDLPYPTDQGAAMRNWGMISGLARKHRVSLLTFASSNENVHSTLLATCARVEIIPTPARNTTDRVRTMLFSTRPDMADRLASDEFRNRLLQIIREERFDAIHVEGLELASYIRTMIPRKHKTPSPMLIFDAHNAETLIQKRAFLTDLRNPSRWPAALYSLLQFPRLQRFEREICASVDKVLCVSQEDASILNGLKTGVNPVLVPNGIWLSDYETPHQAATIPHCSLVFSGKMDYRPNVDAAIWFAHEIFPRIREEQMGEAEFVIVGKDPVERVRRLEQESNITVTGAVADVRPYMAASTVYVAPLRMGGGTRFKIMEAMALQSAVVTTKVGMEGFNVMNGRELIIADSPSEQAEQILYLLDDQERRKQLGQAARIFVEQTCDWSIILSAVENLYYS